MTLRSMLRALVGGLAACLVAACGDGGGAMVDAGPPVRFDFGPEVPGQTVYYVVRHTERNPGTDPPINPEGEVRAEALADLLDEAGIDEIVTTEFIRGPQSGQPLADRQDIPITVAPFSMLGSWPEFGDTVSAWQREREVQGNAYLMIGHSSGYNTQVLRGLGGEVQQGSAERYEDIVILVRDEGGTVTVTEELYGGPSSLDP